MDQYNLRADLQSVFQQFSTFKGDYCKSKIDLRSKDEVIKLQNSAMEAAKRRLDMMATALENYQKNYQNNLHKLQGNNYQLTKTIEELEERCRNLQQTNHDLIMESNRRSNEHVDRLEDEIVILETRIAEKEQRHRDELEKLKEEHEKEMSDKLKIIDQLNEKIRILTEQRVSQKQFVHPAFYDEIGKLKNHPVAKKKNANSAFIWPDLDVQKIKKNINSNSPPPKRMKKLYHEDTTELINLIN